MVEFARLPSKAIDEDEDDINRPASSNSSDNNAARDGSQNLKRKSGLNQESKKKKRKRVATVNGVHKSKRSHSVSKPARDPRDEASPPRSSTDITGTRSPSPVIDFDGLSRPSMSLFLLQSLN
jgi:GTP cyclohydrolase I